MKSAEQIQAEIKAQKQQNELNKTDLAMKEPLQGMNDPVSIGGKKRDANKILPEVSIVWLKSLFRTDLPVKVSWEGKCAYEILAEDSKKRSASYMQLLDSMSELDLVLNKDVIPMDRLSDVILRLSECANAYYDTHRGFRFTAGGENTKKVVNQIRKIMHATIEVMDQKKDDEVLLLGEVEEQNRNTLDAAEGIDADEAEDNVKKLDKAYKNWAINLGSREAGERKRILDKITLFRPYECFIIKYKETHSNKSEWPYCVQQYDLYVRKYRLLKSLEKSEHEKNIDDDTGTGELIRDHAKEMDEQQEETTLSAKEVDGDLRKDQIQGVEEIDRYLIRNFQNGGMLGSVISCLKNNHSDIISELFRKTKRERRSDNSLKRGVYSGQRVILTGVFSYHRVAGMNRL